MGELESINFMQGMMQPIHYHKFLQKSWGFEYWLENNEMYCGKIIQVRQNQWSTHGGFHYHKIKDETFLVLSGTLILDLLQLDLIKTPLIASHNMIASKNNASWPRVDRYYLKPLEYIRLYPGVLHRFSSLEQEVMFVEISTTHREDDSYRITEPCSEDQLEEFSIDHKHATTPTDTNKYSYQKLLDKSEED